MRYFSNLFDKVPYIFQTSAVHHQEYLNTVYTQWVFVILVLLASASVKANKMHYFSNLLDKVLYMFRKSPLPIFRSISTLYTRKRYSSC